VTGTTVDYCCAVGEMACTSGSSDLYGGILVHDGCGCCAVEEMIV